MATGLPVIATNHGGIPEAVTDGHDGILVPERDAAALTNAIMKLAHNPELCREMSRNAAETARANFGSEQQIANLEDLYFEAMSGATADQEVAR
jgi:glycosyltransferase involved in cell wall biosynthesis